MNAAARPQSKSPAPAKTGAGLFKGLLSMRNVLLASTFLCTSALVVHAYASGVEGGAAQPGAKSAVGLLYRDGPPFGFSGGFGEDHCQACHTGQKLNAEQGSLTIAAPEQYLPGETYDVTITLKRPGMALGGFQFTARFEEDSTQAGTLSLPDGEQGRLKVVDDRGIQYAYHKRPGAQLTATDVARWTLRWTAPAGDRTVLFNVAANSANGDEAQTGDFIYTARAQSRGR